VHEVPAITRQRRHTARCRTGLETIKKDHSLSPRKECCRSVDNSGRTRISP
jgi:hypothetical protein